MTKKKVAKVGWYDGVEMPLGELQKAIEREVLRPRLTKDEDGDWPVDVILVDRTRCRELHYLPLPYTHDRSAEPVVLREAGMAALEESLDVAERNLGVAVEEFRRVRREMSTLRRKEGAEDARVDADAAH